MKSNKGKWLLGVYKTKKGFLTDIKYATSVESDTIKDGGAKLLVKSCQLVSMPLQFTTIKLKIES